MAPVPHPPSPIDLPATQAVEKDGAVAADSSDDVNKEYNKDASTNDTREAANSGSTLETSATTIDIKIDAEKKKKKRRGGGKSKGSTKPSGFEEYVVDGPLTKEEAEAELTLYDPSKPFSQRMELCIQRYKARRKWDPTRLQLFSTYLALGGVVTGQKQFFGGIDEKKMDDMDAEHIAMMAATDYIRIQDQHDAEDGDDEWDVDFAFVVRGFLSYKVPYVMGYKKPNELELACKLVKNFLNYVVFHSVAPEYSGSIMEAIRICNLAEKELLLCANVSNRLPGTFNTACSTLFGGFYAGVGDTDKTWEVGVDKVAGFDEKTAKDLFNVALSKRGTPEQQAKWLDRRVLKRDYMSLEVTEVTNPSSERSFKDEDKTLPENKYFRKTETLGSLKLKPWIPEDPQEGQQELPEDQIEELEIWLEKGVLQFCFVGMHLEARVHRLEDNINFIDSVTGVMCSFYLRLENPNMDPNDKDSDDDYE